MKFLSIVFLLLISVPVVDAAPKIRWHDHNAQERAVFKRGRGQEVSVLVKIPYSGEEESMARAFRDDGRELPVRVVHQSPSALHVLVRVGSQRLSSGHTFLVYYGQSLDSSPTQMDNEDTEPVTVEYFSERSRSIPTNWERMRFMMSQKVPLSVTTQGSISEVTRPAASSSGSSRHRHRKPSGGSMVRISTHIVLPDDGLYSFAIDCNDAGFVMVDRESRAAWPGRHANGKAHEGSPVFLSAGPHMLEIYGASASVTRARVSLAEVNSGGKFRRVESMSLVSSAVPVALRIEKKNKTIHAGVTVSVGRPYRFRGMEQTFVPVTLKDFSRNDLSSEYDVRWYPSTAGVIDVDGDSSRSAFHTGTKALKGESLTHLFDSTDLHRVKVEVRDALGFVSSLEREVDTRNLQYSEYSVSATPVNVFPCMYGADIVEPSVRVVMKGHDGLGFLLSWKWFDLDGKEHSGNSTILATRRAKTVTLFSARAEKVGEVEWELSHRGYKLDAGKMKFCSFPFRNFPASASEDRLYDSKGVQLVYVSSRGSPNFKQGAIRTAHLKGGVTCFDDMLASIRPLAGAGAGLKEILPGMLWRDEGSFRMHRLSTRGKHNVFGVAGILLDTSTKTESSGGVAVLSMGRDHFLAYDRPDQFERMLAAVTDILLSRRAMRTVLVTMPPIGDDREAVRKYAVAARRVADARGVPVADLYSGVMGMGENIVPFEGDGSELSDEGLRLTAQIIARTIIGGYTTEGED